MKKPKQNQLYRDDGHNTRVGVSSNITHFNI